MSYDIDLVWSGPGAYAYPFSANYTSNTAQMWREAGCDLAEFDGRPAPELAAALRPAIADMAARQEHYRAMEPSNGWGDWAGTLQFLLDIADACEVHRFAVVRVSR